MKLEIVVPLVAAILTAGGAVIAHIVQKHLERSADYRQRLTDLYASLLGGLYRFRQSNDLTVVQEELSKSWLFASDEVIRNCYDFINTVTAFIIVQRSLESAEQLRSHTDGSEKLIDARIRREIADDALRNAAQETMLQLAQKRGMCESRICLAMRRHLHQGSAINEVWLRRNFHPFVYRWPDTNKLSIEDVKTYLSEHPDG